MARIIEQGTDQELAALETALTAYTKHQKPFTQTETYQNFSSVIKKEGVVIAGGIAYASMYHIGYLDTLWVKASERGKGYGKQILTDLEQQLKAFGCENCQTATFDFQAPDFYQRMGYDEIGRIAHTQNQLTEIFLAKKLHD